MRSQKTPPSRFDPIESIGAKLVRSWAMAGGMLLCLLCMITFLHVLLQSIGIFIASSSENLTRFFSPIRGYEEMIQSGIGIVIFTTLPLCHMEKKHIIVTIFFNHTSKIFKKTHALIVEGMMTMLSVFLFIMMGQGMQQLKRDKVVSSILGLMEWWFYIPSLISLGLWIMVCLLAIFSLQRQNPSLEKSNHVF